MKINQYIFHFFLRAIVAFSILFGDYSCKKEDSPPSGTNSNITASLQIMPLKVGNEWKFKITEYEISGQIEDVKEEIWTVLNDTVINNEKMFYTSWDFYVLNKNDGLYSFDSDYTKIAKYPGIVGESYITTSNDKSTIISTNKAIVCPVGSYTCYQYSTRVSSYITDVYFFSPGNGLIRVETYHLDSIQKPYLWQLRELIKVTLK